MIRPHSLAWLPEDEVGGDQSQGNCRCPVWNRHNDLVFRDDPRSLLGFGNPGWTEGSIT